MPGDRPRGFNDLQLWISIRNATKTYFMRFDFRFSPPPLRDSEQNNKNGKTKFRPFLFFVNFSTRNVKKIIEKLKKNGIKFKIFKIQFAKASGTEFFSSHSGKMCFDTSTYTQNKFLKMSKIFNSITKF